VGQAIGTDDTAAVAPNNTKTMVAMTTKDASTKPAVR
jgi:hypothetical protein